MLASLLGCVFTENTRKKENFKARPRILKIYARLMTPASRMIRDRFIGSKY